MNFSVMEITYHNSDVGIRIVIDNVCVGYQFYQVEFDHRCDSEMERDFLLAALNDQFVDHIEKIRKAAYEAGWRDKTKRRPKVNWFGYCPDVVDPWGGS